MEILKMSGVGLIYQTPEGETEALKDITLDIKDGEFVAIIGPSGCGKTTILSLISGLIKPTSGQVLLGGEQVSKKSGKVGYMLQRDQLFEWRTIKANVRLGLEIQKEKNIFKKDNADKISFKQRILKAKSVYKENCEYSNELLNKYGLGEFMTHLPKQLSGGMRQRAALIRTLAFRPDILLLDEPFSALDYQTRIAVCDDVHSIIKAEKKTAILVTHDISEAISLADRVVVLSARPATIKSIYKIDIGGKPLERRENTKFAAWFDKIYKDINV